MVSAATWGSTGAVNAAWQAKLALHGSAALPPFPGDWAWWAAELLAICAIIGQSGGHGLQGVTAARAGTPPITSMIAARKARSVAAVKRGFVTALK